MLTLAIDCSAKYCAVALYQSSGDQLLAEVSPEIGRGHAERLPEILQTALDCANVNLSPVERIGVTIGPGSFAGIRVGVAFARGLALTLGVPAVGVGTLEAIALPAAAGLGQPVMAVLDARRDRVWALGVAADGRISNQGAELTLEAAARMAREAGCKVLGSGAALLVGIDPSLASVVIGDITAPSIVEVARIATLYDPQSHHAEPRYLRQADAKPQAGFVLARTGV